MLIKIRLVFSIAIVFFSFYYGFAQGNESDSDNDGVLDNYDLCSDTPEGTEVDIDGCPVYRFEPNNFSIKIESSCSGNNGSIEITAVALMDYTVTIIKNGVFGTTTEFTNLFYKIENLTPGNYDVCIVGTDEEITYEKFCRYGIVINDNSFSDALLVHPGEEDSSETEINPLLIWRHTNSSLYSSYDIQIATDFEFNDIIKAETVVPDRYRGLWYNALNLNPSTTYYWRVRPKNNCGEGDFSNPFSFTTTTKYRFEQDGFSVKIENSCSDNSGSIEITAVALMDYTVTVIGIGNDVDYSDNFTNLSHIENLNAGTYKVCIVGTDGGRTYEKSCGNMVINDNSFPDVALMRPRNSLQKAEPDQHLKWRHNSSYTSYNIQISTDVAFATIIVSKSVVPDERWGDGVSYNALNLKPLTTYYWRVKPKNICGEGDFSDPFSFKTTKVMLAPDNFSIKTENSCSGNNSGSIEITAKTSMNYTVTGSRNGGVDHSAEFTDFYKSENLTAGTYNVCIVGTDGEITYEEYCFSITIYDDSFSDVVLVYPENGFLEAEVGQFLEWEHNLSYSYYDIQIATDSEFTTIIESKTVVSSGDNYLGYRALHLEPLTTYYWRVKPKNICGGGDFSDPFSFKTTRIKYRFAPDNFSIQKENSCSGNNNGSIEITAKTSMNYTVTVLGNDVDYSDNFTSLSHKIENLTPGIYNACIVGTDGEITYEKICRYIIIYGNSFSDVVLVYPENDFLEAEVGQFLKWEHNSSYSSYDIQIATDSEFTTIIESKTVVSSGDNYLGYRALHLEPLTTYYWRVKPKNICGGGDFSDPFSFKTTRIKYRFAPDNFSIQKENSCSGNNNGSIEITAKTSMNYTVTVIGNDVDYSDNFTSLSHKIENLTPGIYNACIVGTDGEITYEESCFSITIYDDSFSDVVLVYPENDFLEAEVGQLLAWEDNSSYSSYDIQIATDSEFTTIIESKTVVSSGDNYLGYRALHLEPLTTYYWRVKPKNICGGGDFSDPFSFKTTRIKYRFAPDNFSIQKENSCSGNNNGSIEITAKTSMNYTVTVIGNDVDYSDNFTSLSHKIENLTPGIYNACIVGTDGEITYEESCFSITIYDDSFSDVVLVYPENDFLEAEVGQFLEWEDNSSYSSYDIQIATDSEFTTIIESKTVVSSGDNYLGYRALHLEPLTTYYWRVKPKNICGGGDFSDPFSFKTTRIKYRFAPDNFSIQKENSCSGNNNGSIEITAKTSMNYTVTVIGNDVDYSDNFTSLSHKIENLTPGIYNACIVGTDGEITYEESCFSITIYDDSFSDVVLVYPENDFLEAEVGQFLEWEDNSSYSSYDIQIATDSEFTTIIESKTVVSSGDNYLGYRALHLEPLTIYYWRVKPKNICGKGNFSAPYSFKTTRIKYRFEPNNFSIQKENSCSGNNNGSIEIDAVMPMNYTVTVIRKDIVSTAEFADFYKIEDLTAGTYNVCIVGTDGERTYEEYCFDEVIAELDSSDYVFSDVVLISPENGFLEAEVGQFLKWEHNLSYSSYDIQIATDSEFTPIIESETVVSSGDSYLRYNALNLEPLTTYYWRVKPKNICGEGNFSDPFSFTTKKARFNTDNFSVKIESESCRDRNNGSIEITAKTSMNYTVTVKGNGIDYSADFTSSHKIENLTAGTYNVCIVADVYKEYCFDKVIAELDSSDYVFSDVVLISPENGFLEAEVGQFLKWEHNLSYSSYDIQIATDSEFTPIIESETVVSSGDSYLRYNALNLEPLTTYYWRVKPKNICGEGNFSDPFSFTTKKARFNTDNFSVKIESESCRDRNNGSIEITAKTSMNYTVTVKGNGIDYSADFTSSHKIENLTAGTYNVCIVADVYKEYCFDKVIAELDSSDYVFSDVVLISPENGFLEAEVGQFLKWEHNLSYSSYDIQIATDSEFTPIIESETVVSSGDSYLRYNALNLEPLTTYYWRVKPKNICGEGNFSDPFSFTTKKARFNTDNFSVKIESESCRDRNNGSIEITAKTSMNYTVTVKGNGIDYSADFTSSHKIENLTAGTYNVCIVADVYKEYCFDKVIAELDSSDYVFSDVVLISPENGFLEAEVGQFLKWEHNLSYSSYDIQIATDSEFTPIIESETVVSSGDSYLRYNALNLEPLTTYYWRVKPKNICGEGNFSDPFSFTTKKARFNTDNFSVKIESESCRDRNNGSIEITAKTSMNYTVTVKGNGIDYSADFTSSHKIENLTAGTYNVCIVADVYKEYCFGVVVTEPSPLGVSSKLSIDGKQLALRLSGSAQYNIALNGVVLQTDKYEMALGLKNGANTLKVYSDIPCQGIYEQQIFVSDKPVIYPNPFSDFIDIFLGSMQKEVQITIHTANGQLVSDKNHPVYSNGLKLNFIELPQGVYFLNIKGKTVKGAYKIIKK